MIDRSTQGTGLPVKLQCTYDQLFLHTYDHNAFNSFLHLLALRVAKELCEIKKDRKTLEDIEEALKEAQAKIDDELWSEEDGFYHAVWDRHKGSPSWLMADSLYAQVWAFTLGLGPLHEARKLRSHLKKELLRNDTPFGLKVMTTDHATNLSVGSCPKDLPSKKFNKLVALHESVWLGGSPDWTSLQIHLGMSRCIINPSPYPPFELVFARKRWLVSDPDTHELTHHGEIRHLQTSFDQCFPTGFRVTYSTFCSQITLTSFCCYIPLFVCLFVCLFLL